MLDYFNDLQVNCCLSDGRDNELLIKEIIQKSDLFIVRFKINQFSFSNVPKQVFFFQNAKSEFKKRKISTRKLNSGKWKLRIYNLQAT